MLRRVYTNRMIYAAANRGSERINCVRHYTFPLILITNGEKPLSIAHRALRIPVYVLCKIFLRNRTHCCHCNDEPTRNHEY